MLGAGIFLELLVLGVRERWALCFIGLFSLVGLVDDRRPLPVALRLSVFLLLSAATAWLYLPGHGVLVLGIVALALCWLVNLYNFMDGIDGIAGVQCFLACCSAALLAWLGSGDGQYALFCLLLAAAHTGFLVWNWPPARLFMGDAGSVPTGYLLGALAIAGLVGGQLNIAAWMILLAAYFTGAVLSPALLPWLPFRHFGGKGLVSGLVIYAGLILLTGPGLAPMAIIAWGLISGAVSSFLAMNFTGASTYTSLSGVRKEMRVFVPIQIVMAGIGLVLLLISKFI